MRRLWRTDATKIAAGGGAAAALCAGMFRTATGLKMTMLTSACAGVGAGLDSCPLRQSVDLALRRTAIVGDGPEPSDERGSLTIADRVDDVGDVGFAVAAAGGQVDVAM